MALGLGLGGVAASGAMFHAVNNGLVKGVLFLAAGNIHRSFGTKLVDGLRGAGRRLPLSGPLFLVGFLALTGTPPFSPFFSELAVLKGALAGGHGWVAALYVAFLCAIFVGMGGTVLRVVQGHPEGTREVPGMGDRWLTAGPPLALLLLALALGLHLPAPLRAVFDAAAAQATGGRAASAGAPVNRLFQSLSPSGGEWKEERVSPSPLKGEGRGEGRRAVGVAGVLP